MRLFFPFSASFCCHKWNCPFGSRCWRSRQVESKISLCGLASKGPLDESHNYSCWEGFRFAQQSSGAVTTVLQLCSASEKRGGLDQKQFLFFIESPFPFHLFGKRRESVPMLLRCRVKGQQVKGGPWRVSKILASATSCATLLFVESLHLFAQCGHNVRLQGGIDCREMPSIWGAGTDHAVSCRAVFALLSPYDRMTVLYWPSNWSSSKYPSIYWICARDNYGSGENMTVTKHIPGPSI